MIRVKLLVKQENIKYIDIIIDQHLKWDIYVNNWIV